MEFQLRDEYIRLGQLLKAAGLADSGVDAKFMIQEGKVFVNGEVCTQRGKKVRAGDLVSFEGQEIQVTE